MQNIKFKVTWAMDSNDKITLNILDAAAGVLVADISMTHTEFAQMTVGNLSRVECYGRLGPTEKMGKVMRVDSMIFQIPGNSGYGKKRVEIAKEFAANLCPEGWTPTYSFGSQDSFFQRDGETWARCTIKKWEDRYDE